ncbi:hypothetical protein H696_03760 [Fonticula alba]|uniref:Uncharacterized protein n=1 Tax=Fonticula alba TaxID=691883 RepID=A0A058Z5W1_FONAL|nr:hypothetical protein H696_03760 [Fonticula alba]KCV69328.1 hypothetical protein H696_03760 [Fonticula alba]|eukprot:XP_009495893.1 hypothetical protein H696_03760 [Fonticula alba]
MPRDTALTSSYQAALANGDFAGLNRTAESGDETSKYPEVYELLTPSGPSLVHLVCEHASNRIPPPPYSADGTWPEEDQWLVNTHWALDIGAEALTRELSAALKAKTVLARFSRLMCDANREIGSDTMFRKVADGVPIALNAVRLDLQLDPALPPSSLACLANRTHPVTLPPCHRDPHHAFAHLSGMKNMTPEEEAKRVALLYNPFHDGVTDSILSYVLDPSQSGPHALPRLLLSVHTFTEVYENGEPRDVEVGLLFDRLQRDENFRRGGPANQTIAEQIVYRLRNGNNVMDCPVSSSSSASNGAVASSREMPTAAASSEEDVQLAGASSATAEDKASGTAMTGGKPEADTYQAPEDILCPIGPDGYDARLNEPYSGLDNPFAFLVRRQSDRVREILLDHYDEHDLLGSPPVVVPLMIEVRNDLAANPAWRAKFIPMFLDALLSVGFF